jgi:8-oxo-dGTP pyrophosphatase MutT (NUDIX family)
MPRRSKSAQTPAARAKVRLKREFSAGGIVWRRGGRGGIEVALIRPRHSKAWALPKGHIEQGESVHDAAVREVREETGLKAGVVEKLGSISYIFSWRDRRRGSYTRIFKRVYFFLMQFAGGDISRHDAEVDEVAWVDVDRAIERATYKSERELLDKARAVLRERGVGA